ncbi:MAG TPA: pilus assembly protein TadE [Microlunatus sp.]
MTVANLRRTLGGLLSGPRRAQPDQRGQALSVFVLVATAAIILVAGLVVDGGQKAMAVSRAESVAAGAARAAANAGAGGTLAAGRSGEVASSAARTAAQDYLAGAALGAGPTVHGSVDIRGPLVTVTTSATVQTIFLSVIGIDTLTGSGQATARVVPA